MLLFDFVIWIFGKIILDFWCWIPICILSLGFFTMWSEWLGYIWNRSYKWLLLDFCEAELMSQCTSFLIGFLGSMYTEKYIPKRNYDSVKMYFCVRTRRRNTEQFSVSHSYFRIEFLGFSFECGKCISKYYGTDSAAGENFCCVWSSKTKFPYQKSIFYLDFSTKFHQM